MEIPSAQKRRSVLHLLTGSQVPTYAPLASILGDVRRKIMSKNHAKRRTWRKLLRAHHPLQLHAAHDALAARLIERAGFPAYQIGGFAVDGARFGLPDIDLTRFAEKFAAVR